MINRYTLNSLNEEDFKGLYNAIDVVFKNNYASRLEMISGNEIEILGEPIKLSVVLNFGVFAGSNSYKTKFFRSVVWEEKKLVVDKIIAYLIRSGYSGGLPIEVAATDAYLYMIENQLVNYTEEDIWDNADDYLFEDDIDLKRTIATYDFRTYKLDVKDKDMWTIYNLKNDCINRGKILFLKYNPNYNEVVADLCQIIGRNPDKYLKE